MGSLIASLIAHTPLLSLILGPLVTFLGDRLHEVWGWLDKQSPVVKQGAAVVISFFLVGLVHLIPISAPIECANTLANGLSSECQEALTSGPFLQSIITALVAVAVKHGKQAKKS